MKKYMHESDFEVTVIEMIQNLGYEYYYGGDIRENFLSMNNTKNVVITEILYKALKKINPNVSDKAINEALRKITNLEEINYIDKNKTFQKYLSFGIEVNYFDNENKSKYIKLVDYENIENNYFYIVNQLVIIDIENKRPDVIIYLNGIPLVVMEFKNPVADSETIDEAYLQLKNYMENGIPNLFYYNAFCVITDGIRAEVGTITADKSRFISWKRESEDIDIIDKNADLNKQYKTLINGIKSLNIPKEKVYLVFPDDSSELNKFFNSNAPSFEVISDPTKELYKQLAIKPSVNSYRLYDALAVQKLIKAENSGITQEKIEDLQRTASFIVDTSLKVVYCHYGLGAGDTLSSEKINDLLK